MCPEIEFDCTHSLMVGCILLFASVVTSEQMKVCNLIYWTFSNVNEKESTRGQFRRGISHFKLKIKREGKIKQVVM